MRARISGLGRAYRGELDAIIRSAANYWKDNGHKGPPIWSADEVFCLLLCPLRDYPAVLHRHLLLTSANKRNLVHHEKIFRFPHANLKFVYGRENDDY